MGDAKVKLPAAGPARQAAVRLIAILAGYGAYVALIGVLPGRPAVGGDAVAALSAARGRSVWRERQCQSCHSLYGLGGHTGPDLTNVVSRMSRDYVRHTIVSGLGTMPPFDLPPADADAVAAYLEAVDATGRFPPRGMAEPVFGARR